MIMIGKCLTSVACQCCCIIIFMYMHDLCMFATIAMVAFSSASSLKLCPPFSHFEQFQFFAINQGKHFLDPDDRRPSNSVRRLSQQLKIFDCRLLASCNRPISAILDRSFLFAPISRKDTPSTLEVLVLLFERFSLKYVSAYPSSVDAPPFRNSEAPTKHLHRYGDPTINVPATSLIASSELAECHVSKNPELVAAFRSLDSARIDQYFPRSHLACILDTHDRRSCSKRCVQSELNRASGQLSRIRTTTFLISTVASFWQLYQPLST